MNKILLAFLLMFSSVLKAETIWYPLPKEAYSFGKLYPEAQRMLYAFDYGHALVYERLLINKGKISDPEKFEKDLLKDIFAILKNPPDVKNDEGDIAPNYVYAFPLAINLFDWSHMLHQFVFDVLATSEDRGESMKARINQLFDQYKANKALAITEKCKTMIFMDGHYFSKSFRQNFPSFNLLIWSYHWFQIKLYEDLMAPTKLERDANVQKTIKEFWEMVSDLPDSADFDMMPEVSKVAPTLAKAFPMLPGAFDNNHMLHDIVSDILTSEKVPMNKVKEEGIKMGLIDLDPEAYRSNNCGI
jgi:hypothetical protein